jgi:hypothetical protein
MWRWDGTRWTLMDWRKGETNMGTHIEITSLLGNEWIPSGWYTMTSRHYARNSLFDQETIDITSYPLVLWVIRAELLSNTPAHLEAYRKANAVRLRRLQERPWPGPIPVQITFRGPLSLRAVRALLDAGHLEFESVAGVLAPDFAWGGWVDPRTWHREDIDPTWLARAGWSGDPEEAPLITHLTGWLHQPEDLEFWLDRPEVELVDALGAELEAWVQAHAVYRLWGGRIGYRDRVMPVFPWIEYARFAGERP